MNSDPRLLAAITIAILKYRAERRRERVAPPATPSRSAWVSAGRERQHQAWNAHRRR